MLCVFQVFIVHATYIEDAHLSTRHAQFINAIKQ
jgi:hypothetical protein